MLAAFGSLVLEHPLKFAHPVGTVVRGCGYDYEAVTENDAESVRVVSASNIAAESNDKACVSEGRDREREKEKTLFQLELMRDIVF